MKTSLRLSADQEKLWGPFESAVKDGAKARLVAQQKEQGDSLSPMDRLNATADRLAASTANLNKIVEAAKPLYESLDDALERLGLTEQVGPAQWTLKPGIEPALRDLGIRGDVIKTMHRAMTDVGREPDVTCFALHSDDADEPVLGRLVERGLHDELKGTAYAIIDGVDGRTHDLVFSDQLPPNSTKTCDVVLRATGEPSNSRHLSTCILG